MRRRWTSVREIVDTLRRRWDRGTYLQQYAGGEPWEPVVLPVRGPRASEFLADWEDAVGWAERFARESVSRGSQPRFHVEHRTVRGRGLGANVVPARVRIESFEQLWTLLGTGDDVRKLDSILSATRSAVPELVPWITRYPLAAIANEPVWPRLLATVRWLAERDTSRMYIRQIDVEGVDTKFVERHQKVLGQLLSEVLPASRIDRTQSGFARRYGLRPKPGYLRFRVLDSWPGLPPVITELQVRADELARLEVPVSTMFVVENEVSYLAFPRVRDAVVVFGEGFAVTAIDGLPWLRQKQVVYWGDIDTHGFAILNRLRARLPMVESMLMDRETLLAHIRQIVDEPTPTAAPQPHLTNDERSLYQDLVEDRYGKRVRLEQERVRFGLVRRALHPWGLLEGDEEDGNHAWMQGAAGGTATPSH